MAAISHTGQIQMIGTFKSALELDELRQRAAVEAPDTYFAVADTEQELRDLARKIELGDKELARRAARRKQQKASRRANR